LCCCTPARSCSATRAFHGVRRPFGESDPISSWSPLIHVVGGSAGNNWICGSRRKCFSPGYVAPILWRPGRHRETVISRISFFVPKRIRCTKIIKDNINAAISLRVFSLAFAPISDSRRSGSRRAPVMHVSCLSRFGAPSAVLEATELCCDSALFKAWDCFCPCTANDVKGRGKYQHRTNAGSSPKRRKVSEQ